MHVPHRSSIGEDGHWVGLRSACDSNGEVQEMVDDEKQNDHPAPAHVSRSERGPERNLFLVAGLAGPAILDRQLGREPNVDHDDEKEAEPDGPEGRSERFQKMGVGVDFVRRREDLQIARQVANLLRNHDLRVELTRDDDRTLRLVW